MKFEKISIRDSISRKGTLYSFFSSTNGNYKIQRSLNHNHWLAFFRCGEESYTLVGPPVETQSEAEELCSTHSMGLPW